MKQAKVSPNTSTAVAPDNDPDSPGDDASAATELWTADRLLDEVFPELIWAVPDLLPVGLTILAGRPKAGKSWLALQIARGISSGAEVLGHAVEQGPILYLALEDPRRRLQNRIRAQNWPHHTDATLIALEDFHILVGDLAKTGTKRLTRRIQTLGCRLVVIDTLSRAISGDQNAADVMTPVLAPLQELAHSQEAAILMIDHHNKGRRDSPDAIYDILGSTAKGAMADTIWGLYRVGGKSSATLQVVGRDLEEQELKLEFSSTDSMWHNDKPNTVPRLPDKDQEIIATLRAGPKNATDVARALGQDASNTGKRLKDLVAQGVITRQGSSYSVV